MSLETFYREWTGGALYLQDWVLHMESGQWLPLTRRNERWEELAGHKIRAGGVTSWHIQLELGTQLRSALR